MHGFLQVTLFGESAGAISIGLLFLNSGLDRLIRGAVSVIDFPFLFLPIRAYSRFSNLVLLAAGQYFPLLAERATG